MLILGIESSCDETAVAVVEDGNLVRSSLVASQTQVHERFGGVVPEVAAREHLKAIDPLVQQALKEAGAAAVDAIAVTQGPGLIGALLVGISYAKGLALRLERPLIPVDHVHAHVHGALLGLGQAPFPGFPCLALVVSGGHTNLYFMPTPTRFTLLASTIDDACGEAFDKVAKLLGLSYPGGPAIEALARLGRADRVKMPRMVEQKNRLEFSYSGLKTHIVCLHRKADGQLTQEETADICAAFQDEALSQLIRKVQAANSLYPAAKALLVAGGVSANSRLRELMATQLRLPAFFTSLSYCSDNAAMIAAYGYHVYQEAKAGGALPHLYDWDAYPRYDFAASAQP